ncbi:MAG: MogA/MoaB family molybdenum cofactor biosynthesis protein [Corynebacterium sp.]|nr:MogA/MoaB family molybdenum cofactor biosynthesis protein [Corynebacterium sp.]
MSDVPIVEKQLAPLEGSVRGAVITVSDRCTSGEREDHSGPLAQKMLSEYGVEVAEVVLVPDGVENVHAALQSALDAGARVIITVGGTGVTPRDLTPEATRPFLDVELPGIATQILMKGLEKTPLAGLSRGLVGVTGRGEHAAIIVNSPGSKGGVRDVVSVIGPLVPHILEQLVGHDGSAHQP